MKVVFRRNKTADVSAIQSVSVITAAKRIEVCVKHKTEQTEAEKVWNLPVLTSAFRKKWAEEVAKELEGFSEAPNTPIAQVIDSTAWARGYLQVGLDVNSDTSTWGLARLCWYWALSFTPTDEEFGLRTGLSANEIKKVASGDIYKQHVEDLMFKARDAEAYKKWLKNWGPNMPQRFSARMRLSAGTAIELINSVTEKHGIDPKDLDLRDSSTRRRKNSISEPEKTIGIGKKSVYLYYYPQYRKSAEFRGEKIWECKIGRTIHGEAHGRIRSQATGLPESPKVGLHIKTDKDVDIEIIIHRILKVRGKHIEEAPGTEWFLTSPSEVEEIYDFIGESSCKSALDG